MPCFKKIFYSFLFVVPLVISANSFAFNMPKEFASIGTRYITKKDVLPEKVDDINHNAKNTKNIKTAILTQFYHWKGTRYHFGGTTFRGVDCSALMQHIFNDSFHKVLPRTTTQQIKYGQRVSKEKLTPGDLVFFKTSPNTRHVGVYIGNNLFIHASSSEGVTMSSLTNSYWIEHYETARRLIVIS